MLCRSQYSSAPAPAPPIVRLLGVAVVPVRPRALGARGRSAPPLDRGRDQPGTQVRPVIMGNVVQAGVGAKPGAAGGRRRRHSHDRARGHGQQAVPFRA